MKIKTKIFFLFLLMNFSLIAQSDNFHYSRSLSDIEKTWHTLVLPDSIFSHTKKDLSDVRIMGFTDKDTLEAAYLVVKNPIDKKETNYNFSLINKVTAKEGSYFTLQLSKPQTINQIQLAIDNTNFDWLIDLQGSNNQTKWFNILNDYRILGIKNPKTQYKFTTLSFNDTKFQYFRILVKTKKKVKFKKATIKKIQQHKYTYKNYSIKSSHISKNNINKETIIKLQLENPVPISRLVLDVNSNFDYYRPITIEYVVDSISSRNKTIYTYDTLYKGTLSSIEKPDFIFQEKILQSLQIRIKDADNQALSFSGFTLMGIPKKLLIRFTNPEVSFKIYYGKKQSITPEYDIKFFKNIPKEAPELRIGKESIINSSNNKESALFTSKFWLWLSMGLLIILLGFFSFDMIHNK